MNATGRIIAKNASVLMVSQVLTWVFTITLTIFLPRFLGPSAIGKFHIANSLYAIVAVVATFGMDLMMTKEIARDPQKTSEFFGTSVVLRTLFYLGASVIVAGTSFVIGYPVDTLWVIFIVAIANLINQIVYSIEASLKGLERMEYISFGNIISKAFLTVISVLVLLLGYGVIPVALVGIGAALVNLFIQFRYLRGLQDVRFTFKQELVGWFLRASFPYFLISVFIVLYRQVDIVVISVLASEEVVGWYGAADQLFGTLLFLPTVFITAIYPALSRMYADNSDSLPKLMRKSFEFMFLVSIPVGFGLVVISNQLVVLLFGNEFINSGPVLALIGIVLLFTYQNTLLGYYLISMDRQKIMIWIMAISTIATILLDIILVPLTQRLYGNGAIGGVLAYIFTESIALVVIVGRLPNGAISRESLGFSLKVILAGIVMVGIVWWLREYFIVIPIATGALVYSGMILLLRALPQDDIVILREVGNRIIARFKNKSPQYLG